MISFIISTIFYLLSFIAVISIIVFIHEFGHFLASRAFGVHVEEFAIGFGKKLFSWRDKKGTLWKFCIIPMGGYVMNFGDESASSPPGIDQIENMSENDKKKSMFAKKPWQKIIIALAGPFANFLSAWILLVLMFIFYGFISISPIIGKVQPDSPAFRAGLLPQDRIMTIENENIDSFLDIQKFVGLSLKENLTMKIQRGDEILHIEIKPEIISRKTNFGNEFKMGKIGIESAGAEFKKISLFPAMNKAFYNSINIIKTTFFAIKQIVFGQRSIKEMGGPIQIANHAGKAVSDGFWPLISLIVLISMSIGFLNLLPIPSLDGSHVLFYIIEMFCNSKGKENLLKIQALSFKIGMVFLILLSAIISYNDLKILLGKFF